MAIKYRMKDEFLAPYQARLRELESIPDSQDPFEEIAVIREVFEIMRAWLNDMQDSTKVYEIEDNEQV